MKFKKVQSEKDFKGNLFPKKAYVRSVDSPDGFNPGGFLIYFKNIDKNNWHFHYKKNSFYSGWSLAREIIFKDLKIPFTIDNKKDYIYIKKCYVDYTKEQMKQMKEYEKRFINIL